MSGTNLSHVTLDEEDPAEPNRDIIVLDNVHKTYLLGVEGVPALRGVSVTVHRGEFVVLYGKSGSGKTTMLNLLGTIDRPTRGTVSLDGLRVTESTPDSVLALLRLRKIGFVFQTFNLLSSMNALENVMVPMVMQGDLSPADRKKRAIDLMTMVGLADRLTHLPSELSGGEQQRVTIARAMAHNPSILLLDEPTGDLDSASGAIVMRLLAHLNRDLGITCVMVTHDMFLRRIAHRIIYMRDGKINRVTRMADAGRAEFLADLDRAADAAESSKSKTRQVGESLAADAWRSSEAVNVHQGITQRKSPSDYPQARALVPIQSSGVAVGPVPTRPSVVEMQQLQPAPLALTSDDDAAGIDGFASWQPVVADRKPKPKPKPKAKSRPARLAAEVPKVARSSGRVASPTRRAPIVASPPVRTARKPRAPARPKPVESDDSAA